MGMPPARGRTRAHGLGSGIRKLRKEAGWSQTEFGDRVAALEKVSGDAPPAQSRACSTPFAKNRVKILAKAIG